MSTAGEAPDRVGAFRALVADRQGEVFAAQVRELGAADLPDGDTVVRVAFSDLNYKDALAVADKGRILQRLPLVPGIDLVGAVVESATGQHAVGDSVLINGYGIGEGHWGGYTQLTRVRSDWLVPVPAGLTAWQAAAIGTAGYTAMLSVMALEDHGVAPGDGPVAVTGASGGVGSYAVALLAKAGYEVVASTGRPRTAPYLRRLGATDVIGREVLEEASKRPMGSERWAGAVDAVGGATLAGLIATTRRHGSIAACGLAGGHGLETTVFPFILRGVSLLGIDSNFCLHERREEAWDRLAKDLTPETIELIAPHTVALGELPELSIRLLAGDVEGRVVVDLGAESRPRHDQGDEDV
ncbi:MAG: MDR family oxidoreductase [Anaerolineae bacterium]